MAVETPLHSALICLYLASVIGLFVGLSERDFFEKRFKESAWQEDPPYVTVQLPLYNERFVIRRLLKAVAGLDYPHHRLEIQVLDDSTDETCETARRRVDHYQQRGLSMTYIQRRQRKGFKAGALRRGMETAKGEFLAIFDADFLPPRTF